MNKLLALFKKPNQKTLQSDVEKLALKSRLKSLEMEIAERDRDLSRLKAEIAQLRENRQEAAADHVDSTFKSFFEELSPHLSQLHTQRYLALRQGKVLQPAHIFAVLDHVTRVLAKYGLQTTGEVGETVPFNPDRHTPLSLMHSLVPGDLVAIRFIGLSYRGQLVRKAGVEPVEGTV